MGAPRRKWGQHWLASDAVARDLVGLIAPVRGERFLEIGPGRGRLTHALLEHPISIVAVEVDPECCASLERSAAGQRLQVIHADVLEADDRIPWDRAPFRIVGNLPYNVSSPILRWTAERRGRLTDAHYMLQLEVAERLAAVTGTRDYGYLSVLVQARFRVEILLRLSPGAFRPPPRVDSAFVRLLPRPPRGAAADPESWLPVAAAAFGHRRKTLVNALALGGWDKEGAIAACAAVGVDPQSRAERLTPADFARLAAALRQ